MESKKINQLATELTPSLSDLTIIGDPSTGISKKITLSQMASLFTGTVEEYPNIASFPLVGVADTIYIALDTNVLYRWDTGLTSYVELSPNIINSLVFNDANGFDGTIALVGSVATLTITTALTTGSVGFIGASGALLQDNANFFWDDTNNRLGIGTNAPTTALDVFGSGIIGRVNGTSTNNAFLGFASAGTNKWSVGNVQSDHRFRIYNEATTSELVSVLQTGEFGIGIANPTTKFHIDGAATALIANLDANVSVAKSISFRSDNSNRINLEVSGTESGSNAGANFFLRTYTDAGALLNTPLTITRSTGAVTLSGTLNLTEIQASTSGGLTLKSNSGTSVALFGAGGGAGTTLYGGLSGTSATFSGITTASILKASLFQTTDTSINIFQVGSDSFSGGFFVYDSTAGVYRLKILNSGAAIFSGSITATTATFSSSVVVGTTALLNFGPTTKFVGMSGNNSTGTLALYANNVQALAFAANSYASFSNGATFQDTVNIIDIGTNTKYLQFSVSNTIATISTNYTNTNIPLLIQSYGNANQIYLNSNGNTLFGTSSDSGINYKVQINGNLKVNGSVTTNRTALFFPNFSATGVWELGSDPSVGAGFYFYLSSTGYQMTLSSAGVLYTPGGGTSDRRTKEDILEIKDNALLFINELKPVSFKFIKDETKKTRRGFIAQDVLQTSIPSLVLGDGDEENGTYGLDYDGILALSVKAIQELKAEVEYLKSK
jgi:hypothetical protein